MRLEKHAGQSPEDRLLQEQRQRDRIAKRADAFRAVFSSPSAAEVLEDLEDFCFANKTTVDGHDTNMAVKEGRRQVWLHIQQLLNQAPKGQAT